MIVQFCMFIAKCHAFDKPSKNKYKYRTYYVMIFVYYYLTVETSI